MYDKICKACGRRLSEFYETYMLGCPECYKAFESEITASLKKVHGAFYHSGKLPKTHDLDRELINEYERLIKMREQATINGEFSQIKELSAQIASLYEELKLRGLL